MFAKVAVIESTESTEKWRTAYSGAAEVHSACKGCSNRVHRVHREQPVHNLCKIEYTESTENWRTALSGAAEVHSACCDIAKVAIIIESTESTENWRTAYSYAIGADRRKMNSEHTAQLY